MTAPFPAQALSGDWQTVVEAEQLASTCLAASDVESGNRFFSQPRLCEFMSEGRSVRYRWEYSGAQQAGFVVLQGNDLQVLAHVAPTLSNNTTDERPWWEYPVNVQPLAWALENAAVLEFLQRLLGCPLTVTGIIKANDTEELHTRPYSDLHHSLKLHIETRDRRHCVHLRLSSSTLHSLECDQRWMNTNPRHTYSRLFFDAIIAMPIGIFNRRELREIAVGDVLLTGFNTLSKLPFYIGLANSRNYWRGHGNTNQWMIDTKLEDYRPQTQSSQNYPIQIHPLLASPISMDTIADIEEVVQSPSAEGALSPLDKLNIELSLQVDKRQLSLREIEHLQPGFVFTLPQAVNELKLTFLANNIPVGRGELVAVGKQLGVRVIEWNTHGL